MLILIEADASSCPVLLQIKKIITCTSTVLAITVQSTGVLTCCIVQCHYVKNEPIFAAQLCSDQHGLLRLKLSCLMSVV